ncbi:hypothetical protein [Zhaonella formicivorans]|nr:hypothetical protein [Zhaonella formicivorans]
MSKRAIMSLFFLLLLVGLFFWSLIQNPPTVNEHPERHLSWELSAINY